MNDETYEALKRVVEVLKKYSSEDKKNDKRLATTDWRLNLEQKIRQVEGWIDETAKEHPEEEKTNSNATHKKCGNQNIEYGILNGNYWYHCHYCNEPVKKADLI